MITPRALRQILLFIALIISLVPHLCKLTLTPNSNALQNLHIVLLLCINNNPFLPLISTKYWPIEIYFVRKEDLLLQTMTVQKF